MRTKRSAALTAPYAFDPWIEMSHEGLPPAVLSAFEEGDWAEVRQQITDAVAPRGIYGRQVIHLRRRLPLGVDPVLTQHRGLAAVAFGDWDDLERCIADGPTDAIELTRTRDAILAPLGTRELMLLHSEPVTVRGWDLACGYEVGLYRRYIQDVLGWRPDLVQRPDVPRGRFVRRRRLQELALAAHVEAVGGDLEAAIALASEARQLDDEGDVLGIVSADIEALARHARGQDVPLELGFLAHFATPKGTMPLDAATFLLKMLPLLAAARHADLAEASRMAEWLAIRLSSPRLQFLGHSWRALANALDGNAAAAEREARGLLTEARRVRPALRVVPQLLEAIATKQVEAFVAAESFARRSGHVWAQASALLWLAALAPTPAVATRARRLFTATGWRRPPGVADIGAQAVAGLLGEGARGTWVLELARAIAPLSAAVPVAVLHVRDRALPAETRMLALEILKQAGATSAREELRPVAREQGPLGHAAAEWLASPGRPLGLSERELQVLELAGDGLTDKAIADRLGLSWHTVARHLANARSKLGATNRSAAAVALEQLRHKGATR